MENQQRTWEDWAAEMFVGNNYYFYKKKWENQSPNGSFSSWNWAAFLFPYYWLAYRKMYLYAFLSVIASFASTIIPFGGIITHVVTGVYANYWYYNKCNTAIKTASQYRNEDAAVYLKKQGGTSGLSLFLSIVINILLASAIFAGLYTFYLYTERTTSSSVELTSPSLHTTDVPEAATYEVTTKDGHITYTVPEYYVQTEYENPDLFLSSDYNDLTLLSYDYRQEDFDDTVDELFFIEETARQYSEEYMIEPVTDTVLPVLDSNTSQALFSNADEGIVTYYYITCKKIDKYYVITLFVSSPDNWLKYQKEIVEIISSATSNKTI